MDSVGIAYIKLSTERKKELQNIMVKGNDLLCKWHKRYIKIAKIQDKGKVIRSRISFFIHLYKKANKKAKPISIFDFIIPKEDIEKIFAVKNIEEEMMCGYSAYVLKCSNMYFRIFKNHPFTAHNTIEDYYNENIISLQNCIYTYNRENIQFITFLGRSIRTNVYRFVNKSNKFCQLPNACIKLRITYEKLSLKYPYLNENEIINKMNINDEDREMLLASYRTMKGEADSFDDSLSIYDGENESISFKGNFNNNLFESNFNLDTEKFLDWEILEGLTPLEREVLYNHCLNEPNWREQVAKNNKNPQTGKNYSRYGISIIEKRILKKFATVNKETLAKR